MTTDDIKALILRRLAEKRNKPITEMTFADVASVDEAAYICKLAPGTIYNLSSGSRPALKKMKMRRKNYYRLGDLEAFIHFGNHARV